MAIDVTMPQMGESVVEGTIAKWLVKEGDVVTEDQPLVEISTDKVDTEIPSPGAGRIAKIVAEEGQTLPVGATLAVIEPAGAEAPAKLKVVTPKAPAPKPEPAPAQVKPALRHSLRRRRSRCSRRAPVFMRSNPKLAVRDAFLRSC